MIEYAWYELVINYNLLLTGSICFELKITFELRGLQFED